MLLESLVRNNLDGDVQVFLVAFVARLLCSLLFLDGAFSGTTASVRCIV
jgi:hypothetical protein